jgi:hypothetical protein
MFKLHFFHGLLSGIMAAIAAIIFNRIHFFATEADFSRIINAGTMFSANLIVCLLFSILYFLYLKILKGKAITIFHIILSVASFAATILPISISLPLDIKNPELFPGLAVPMVFFPAIAWFTFKPLFLPDKPLN